MANVQVVAGMVLEVHMLNIMMVVFVESCLDLLRYNLLLIDTKKSICMNYVDVIFVL